MLIPSILVLADGAVFEGASYGPAGYRVGEVVFNTAQTGYQEIITDPSYTGQIVVFTQPHIGNVGINPADMESAKVWLNGVVIKDFASTTSNWRATETLHNFLMKHNTLSIFDIDTRAITQHLRTHGSQSGCLMAGAIDYQQALDYAKSCASLAGKNLAAMVTTQASYAWNKLADSLYKVVLFDFGVKHSILNLLAERGCEVIVVPANTSAAQILALKPDGIVLSNGPGDPAACTDIIATINKLLTHKIPTMGICLGHQLLALASGAKTNQMAFGHHGANHPVLCLKSGKVFISSQNHGFVVAEDELPSCLRVTHRSLFDGTIAGLERCDLPAFSFQGHPEANPGPVELNSLFNQFIHLMEAAACQKQPTLLAS